MRKTQIEIALGTALTMFAATALLGQTSSLVFFGHDHRLHYAKDEHGNRIMDFSYAGYEGGGVELPHVRDPIFVTPSGGDDTAAIQSAINQVSLLPPDEQGFRGAVQLDSGTFNVSRTLKISTSGVVFRGRGTNSDGTVINMTGAPFSLLNIAGSGSPQTVGSPTTITDSYVPSGARSFHVDNASDFKPGDTVLISRPVTAAWVHFMGMDTLVRNGTPQTWISPGSSITTDRTIARVDADDNRITLDVPLTDSLDSKFVSPPDASIAKYTFQGRIEKVAAEGFTAIAHPQNVDITQPQFSGLSMSAVMNAWMRDIVFQDTQNTISISGSVKKMTLDEVRVIHTVPHTGDGPADFALSGTQILANKCSVTGKGNTWPAVTQSRVTGPVVLLNFFGDDRGFDPHQRWATGLLCDNCNFPNSHTADKAGIAYSDRGILGSGHGWDAGWSIAWNVQSTYFLVQQPPGAQNFCIGCVGTILTEAQPGSSSPLLPNGIYESFGTPVTPSSLYLEQLCERLGPRAVADIGYPHICRLRAKDSRE